MLLRIRRAPQRRRTPDRYEQPFGQVLASGVSVDAEQMIRLIDDVIDHGISEV